MTIFNFLVFFASFCFVLNFRHNISTNMNTNTNINIIFLLFFLCPLRQSPKGWVAYGFFILLTLFFFLNFYAYCPHGDWRRVFLISFFGPSGNHSMVIAGGAFFRPLSQSLRWRLVVRGLFSFLFSLLVFWIVAPKPIAQWWLVEGSFFVP